RAPDQQQVALRVDLDHLEAALGDTAAAHAAWHAGSLEHTGRVGAGADRARRAYVVGAMGYRSAMKVVAADRAREALADPGARDLHLLARLEGLDGHRVADLRLLLAAEVGVAELDHGAKRPRAGLLQVSDLGLGQLAL